MEPFTFNDDSDNSVDELDYEPPPRRAPTRRFRRSTSPIELEVDEEALEKIRSRARQATSDFLDNCDAMRQKAKVKDEDALRKFDAAIEPPASATRQMPSNLVSHRSPGLPPLMLRPTREGSWAPNSIITTDSSSFRRASLGFQPFGKEINNDFEGEMKSSAMPPMMPRRSSLGVRHRSPHLPQYPPPTTSTKSSVMNEIDALEAFGRDPRPLHEKLQRGPVIRSRFARSVTPESRFLTSPRESPVRSGSLAPRSNAESKLPAPQSSTVADESEIRERISTRRKMRDVESRLDKILDYELPYASGFKEMRSTLRGINEKMAKHRMLIDRYSGLQMNEDKTSVADRVAAKVQELVPRMPALSGVQNPFKPRSDEVTSGFDPRLVPGYSTGLCVIPNGGTQELRGRIRNLLCRTRETSRKDEANPHLRPLATNRRTAAAVAE